MLREHTLDEGEQSIDGNPPETPSFIIDHIQRGVGPQLDPCTGSSHSTDCDELGWISVTIVETGDDRTSDEQIGYIIEIEGDAPEGLERAYPVRAEGPSQRFTLSWSDGDTDDQERLSFTIALTAVDLGGNMSEPSAPVQVSHPGSTASEIEACRDDKHGAGCATTDGHRRPAWYAGVLSAWLLARRKAAARAPS